MSYRGADKSSARPTSRCILFDGENISFDARRYIHTECLKTCHKLFLGIPHPQLSKNVPINMGPKVNRFRDTDLRTYSLDTSYCLPFRTLSITHNNVFLVNHSISRISTQQWISRNLFTVRPMLIGTFLLSWECPGKVCDIGFETHDIYI
jgi:hypothetical protein